MRKKISIGLITLMASGLVMAETPAEWAARWQGIQNGVTLRNYSGVPSWRGEVLSSSVRDTLVAKVEGLSVDDVWNGLMVRDTTSRPGKTISAYGTCIGYIQGSDRLFLIQGQYGTHGHSGYPKNPSSGDSTGYTTACFNEHTVTGVCRSGNWKEQAKQTLLMALRNDACTDFAKLDLKSSSEVSILDSKDIYYVSPDDYCAGGKPLCGTTRFGDKQGEYASFNQLPEKFCRASYGVLEKSLATSKVKGSNFSSDQRFITCDQLNQKKINSDILAQAKSVMSSLNDRLYILDLPFSGYTDDKLKAMGDTELALFLASVNSDPNLIRIDVLKSRAIALSEDVKEKGRVEYDKLLTALKKAAAEGSLKPTYTLDQAISYIEQQRN